MNAQLEAVERAAGATFARFAERELPACFRGVDSEWAAVRHGCGLLDARFRGLLRLTGADRTAFAQGMLSNDVARLRDGAGTYAALLTQPGKIVSDLRVYALADMLWLDVPAHRREAVRDGLEHHIVADDVELAVDEAWSPLVALEGPDAVRTLHALSGEAVDDLEPFAHREIRIQEHQARVAAVSHTGESGYLLFGAVEIGAALWERCREAGATAVGMCALDVLRLEAGIPWYGCDMDESFLISEVGLETAISYKKGCYLGQEVVERVASRGQVQRKLIGLLCEGRTAPPRDAKLIREGEEVGWITSAVWSPARKSVIALGYARRGCWDPGSEVAVGEMQVAARIVPLPFYVRPA